MSDELPILHLDEHLVAVDKPPGLLVHRTKQAPDRDVVLQRVAQQLGRWLYPVHRLDRGTSGVLVFALTSEAAAAIQRALQSGVADKQYLVAVRGDVGDFEVRRPLTGKQARTEFERVAPLPRGTLLRARPRSGRRHQIRRHLAHCRHQVLGDRRYGKSRINQALREAHGLTRQFLHARRLTLPHPGSGLPLTVEAPLADDLSAVLRSLGLDPDLISP